MWPFYRYYSQRKTLDLITASLDRKTTLNVWKVVEETGANWSQFTDSFVKHLREGTEDAGAAFSYKHSSTGTFQAQMESVLRHVQQDRVKVLALSAGMDGILIGLATDHEAAQMLVVALQGFATTAQEQGVEFIAASSAAIFDFGGNLATQIIPSLSEFGARVVAHYVENPQEFIGLGVGIVALITKHGGGELLKHAIQNAGPLIIAAREAFAPIAAQTAATAHLVGEAGMNAGSAMTESGGDVAEATIGVGIDLPWITIATSGLREISLVVDGKKDWGTALTHTATDVGSVAIGGKVGAVVGSVFGPIGMVVGGAGGALLGRLLSEGIRHADLDEAVEAFKKQQQECETEMQQKLHSVVSEYAANANQAHKEFQQLAEEIALANNATVSRFSANLADEAIRWVESYRITLRQSKETGHLPLVDDKKLVGSFEKHLQKTKFREAYHAILSDADLQAANLIQLLITSKESNSLEHVLRSLVLPANANHRELEMQMTSTAKAAFVEFVTGNFVAATLLAYKGRETSADLLAQLRKGVEEIKSLSKSLAQKVQTCTDRVYRERRKLGLA